MKINIVSPYSFSEYGGVNAQIVQMAKEYLRLGHEVKITGIGDSYKDIYGCFEDFEEAKQPAYNSLSIEYLGKSTRIPANGSDANIGIRPGGLWKVLVENPDTDIIHLHEAFAPGPTLMHLLRPKTVPIVATFHRNGVDTLYGSYMKAAKFLRHKIDYSAAVSLSAKNTIESVGGVNPQILYNGIDLTEFKTSKKAIVDKPAVNALFVGRFEPRKGYEIFLDSIKLLKDRENLINFTIIGSGVEFDIQKELFREYPNVTWISNLDRKSLVEKYLEADIFVSPATHSESFGLVLLEAMAAGNLLLVSQIQPFKAVLGDAGLYFRPGDSVDLANNIRALLEDKDRILEMKNKALERVKEFSMRTLAAKYMQVYETLTA